MFVFAQGRDCHPGEAERRGAVSRRKEKAAAEHQPQYIGTGTWVEIDKPISRGQKQGSDHCKQNSHRPTKTAGDSTHSDRPTASGLLRTATGQNSDQSEQPPTATLTEQTKDRTATKTATFRNTDQSEQPPPTKNVDQPVQRPNSDRPART